MTNSDIRDLREALPPDERHAVVPGSDFWDDPKVMFEHPHRTPPVSSVDGISHRLRSMPSADRAKAIAAITEVLDDGYYLLRGKGPSETPTYIRPRE